MAAKPRMTAEESARLDAQPVPESGNLVNALHTLRKAEVELSGRTPPEIAAIHAKFATIQTRGDAETYARSVLEKVRIAQEQRKLASQPQRKP
jgi:hypothetical protein